MLSVKPYQSDVVSPSDYIMSEAYRNEGTVVGSYYGYKTFYYKTQEQVVKEDIEAYIKEIFKVSSDDDIITIVKKLSESATGVNEFLLYTVTDYLTSLANIYIQHSINSKADIDDIVTDIEDLVTYFSKEHSYNIELFTNYVKEIFFINHNNASVLAEHISQPVETGEDGVNLYVVPIIKVTPLCGILRQWNEIGMLYDKIDNELVRPGHCLYEFLKQVEDSSKEFKEFGFIDTYNNKCSFGSDRDKITVFKVTPNTYKVLK